MTEHFGWQVVEQGERLTRVGGGPSRHGGGEIGLRTVGGAGEGCFPVKSPPTIVEIPPLIGLRPESDQLFTHRCGIRGSQRLQQSRKSQATGDGVRVTQGLPDQIVHISAERNHAPKHTLKRTAVAGLRSA